MSSASGVRWSPIGALAETKGTAAAYGIFVMVAAGMMLRSCPDRAVTNKSAQEALGFLARFDVVRIAK